MSSICNSQLNTVPFATRIVTTNEKVTGPAGAEMLRQSGMRNTSLDRIDVMDNACGGGVITFEVLKLAKENSNEIKLGRIVASDNDEKMIRHVRRRREESGWKDVEVMQFDQQSVPLPDDTFSHIFNNFGVFFAPNDDAALAETFRLLKPGGVAGFTSWKTIAWWPQIAMPALSSFIPEAPKLPDPSTVFPARGWSAPSVILPKLEKAGFRDIQISEYSFAPEVEAEEFSEAAGLLVKIITKKLWSEKANEKYGNQIEPAVRSYLLENFPKGKWDGKMTAIVSIGKRI